MLNNLDIRALLYSMAEDLPELMYIGLTKNKEVDVGKYLIILIGCILQ